MEVVAVKVKTESSILCSHVKTIYIHTWLQYQVSGGKLGKGRPQRFLTSQYIGKNE